MKQNQSYRVVRRSETVASQDLAQFLGKDGQVLLPMRELIERAELAVDEILDVVGPATIEAVMSAQRVNPA